MITPTIGRVVWYTPRNDAGYGTPDQPFPALVCYVHDDRKINLHVSDMNGNSFGVTEVTLLQDSDTADHELGFAQWMPYQIAAASVHVPVTDPNAPAPAV